MADLEILQRLNPNVAAIQPYSPGRPIEEVARELGLDPDTVIKLASNESALGPSPLAMHAIRESADQVHRYPDGGAWRLRTRIAEHYDVAMENVVVGNGSNEILEFLGHCFLQPGRSAVFSAHAFVVYKLVSVLFGAEQIEVPCAPGLNHDLDAMLAAIRPDTALVFVCNPNNPTSTMVDPEALERFIAAVPPHVLVVVDEAYAEIAHGPMPDSMQWVRDGRNVLVCRTFSKAYGLAGLRLGYAIAPASLARALQQARQPFNTNLIAQEAAIAALDDQDFVAEQQLLYAAGKTFVEAECIQRGLSFIPGFANFMLIEVGDGAAVTKALQARGIIVRPMAGYGLPQYIRVTFGTIDENERFILTLFEILEETGIAP